MAKQYHRIKQLCLYMHDFIYCAYSCCAVYNHRFRLIESVFWEEEQVNSLATLYGQLAVQQSLISQTSLGL